MGKFVDVYSFSGCMTHLMDDDLASLSGILLLSSCDSRETCIFQLTLSLYSLMQSLLKLKTSTNWSILAALSKVAIAHFALANYGEPVNLILLEFIYRKTIIHLSRKYYISDRLAFTASHYFHNLIAKWLAKTD